MAKPIMPTKKLLLGLLEVHVGLANRRKCTVQGMNALFQAFLEVSGQHRKVGATINLGLNSPSAGITAHARESSLVRQSQNRLSLVHLQESVLTQQADLGLGDVVGWELEHSNISVGRREGPTNCSNASDREPFRDSLQLCLVGRRANRTTKVLRAERDATTGTTVPNYRKGVSCQQTKLDWRQQRGSQKVGSGQIGRNKAKRDAFKLNTGTKVREGKFLTPGEVDICEIVEAVRKHRSITTLCR